MNANRALRTMRREAIETAKVELRAKAQADGMVLASRPAGRTAAKELMREGVFEPNGCMGYRLRETGPA